jgi:aldehyde dehydrogenase (NAD+)
MPAMTLLQSLGVSPSVLDGDQLATFSPIDGAELAKVQVTDPGAVTQTGARAYNAYLRWRTVPAPQRGELVRLLGEVLRANKQALGELVTLEVGKVSRPRGWAKCRR